MSSSDNTPTVILYHYEGSPYARKVRWFLQLLSIPYVSWPQPMTLPRPALNAQGITYRRIPILNINGQTYCDSSLIVSVLRSFFSSNFAKLPEPTGADVAFASLLADYSDRILFNPVAESMSATKNSPLANSTFRKDRRGFGRALGKEDMPYLRENGLNELRRFLELMEGRVFADGRKWVLGGEMGEIDVTAAVFPQWSRAWTEGMPGVEIAKFPKVGEWLQRVVGAVRSGEKKVVREIKSDEEGLALVKELREKHGKEIEQGLGAIDRNVPLPLNLGQIVDVIPVDSGRSHPQRAKVRAVLGDRFAVEVSEGGILWFPWRGFEVRKVPEEDGSKL